MRVVVDRHRSRESITGQRCGRLSDAFLEGAVLPAIRSVGRPAALSATQMSKYHAALSADALRLHCPVQLPLVPRHRRPDGDGTLIAVALPRITAVQWYHEEMSN